MGEHYYSSSVTSQSHEQQHLVQIEELQLRLTTDHGVFSKRGLDFGSRVLLQTVHQLPETPQRCLDIGCGYGPIGIALGKWYPQATVDMVDVNARALALAQKNAVLNQADNVTIFQSDTLDSVTETDYDLIVSNPPIRAGKSVVHRIISDSYQHLAPGGRFVAVIQKKQGAPSAFDKMMQIYRETEILTKEKGYWILSGMK